MVACSRNKKGVLYAILSALLFGIIPLIGKLSFAGGSNGITLMFLRSMLAVPLLILIHKKQGIPLIIEKKQLKTILYVGILGPCATTLLLYSSYEYIATGMATVLHFIYPVGVVLANRVFHKERLSPTKFIALILATGGIVFFFEQGLVNIHGVSLALLSGLTYVFYMERLEHSNLREVHYLTLTLYFVIIGAVVSGVYGAMTGNLNLKLTAKAWVYSGIVAFLGSVLATTLFQRAITCVGASTTALLSTLEPITSIMLGRFILAEALSMRKIIGAVLIIISVFVIGIAQVGTDNSSTVSNHVPGGAEHDI